MTRARVLAVWVQTCTRLSRHLEAWRSSPWAVKICCTFCAPPIVLTHVCARLLILCSQDMMEDEDYEFDYEDSDQVRPLH